MKSAKRLFFLCLVLSGLIILHNLTIHWTNKINDHESKQSITTVANVEKLSNVKVSICVVVCGDRLHEALTMLKSALVFAQKSLHFIVISEPNLIPAFEEKLAEWQIIANKTFTFVVQPITFPKQSDTAMWKKLFKPCAAQRLFLPVTIDPKRFETIKSTMDFTSRPSYTIRTPYSTWTRTRCF